MIKNNILRRTVLVAAMPIIIPMVILTALYDSLWGIKYALYNSFSSQYSILKYSIKEAWNS